MTSEHLIRAEQLAREDAIGNAAAITALVDLAREIRLQKRVEPMPWPALNGTPLPESRPRWTPAARKEASLKAKAIRAASLAKATVKEDDNGY